MPMILTVQFHSDRMTASRKHAADTSFSFKCSICDEYEVQLIEITTLSDFKS